MYHFRIGRTGRRGRKGKSTSFLDESEATAKIVTDLIEVLEEAKQEVSQDLRDLLADRNIMSRRQKSFRKNHSSFGKNDYRRMNSYNDSYDNRGSYNRSFQRNQGDGFYNNNRNRRNDYYDDGNDDSYDNRRYKKRQDNDFFDKTMNNLEDRDDRGYSRQDKSDLYNSMKDSFNDNDRR